jgi:imidazole glycerol-phosphate synthase subunit HisH
MARFDIVIVDYGMANLRSVQKAFEQVGFPAHITSDANQIREAHKVVLPGVGAFQDAIAKLRDTQLADVLKEHIHGGRSFLGICLGLQMLFTQSHEDGQHLGLGLTPGEVVRFPKEAGLKVPHMGWNSLRLTQPNCPLFRGLPAEPYFYFVHGYYAEPSDKNIIAAETDYPTPFCSVIWQDNLYATQFHPEKSQAVGLQMLKNFAQL